MLLTYNGVSLEVEQVLEFSQTPVYSPDGKDYLYTHYRISVRAVWNQFATQDGIGSRAALSIINLRPLLLEPRKLLRFLIPRSGVVGETYVLTSPILTTSGERLKCDANNGPTPIAMNIVSIIGEKTAIVDYTVETWKVEFCTSGMKEILSHRWEMSHDVDENYFTTRTINGYAIFRRDMLTQGSNGELTPDWWRTFLFHPVPNRFKRQSIHVSVDPGGEVLRYSFQDVEQPAMIDPNVRRISHVEGYYQEGCYGGLDLSLFNPLGHTLPRVNGALFIRVRGIAQATRNDLVWGLTRGMIAYKMGQFTVLGLISTASANVRDILWTFDIVNKEASVMCQFDMSGSRALALRATNLMPGLQFAAGGGGGNPDVIPETITGLTVGGANAPGHVGMHSAGRGSYLEYIVAKVLHSPCAEIRTPVATNTDRYTKDRMM